MAVPFQPPVAMVPKVVMVVLPVFASTAIVPRPKVVLWFEAAASSSKAIPAAVKEVVE